MKVLRKISFFILLSALVFPGITKSQCDSINLGPDTVLCLGQTLQLDAGEGFISYLWNDSTTDQFLTVNETGTYWCEVVTLDSTNLVYNGDFSFGNTGFYTDYVVGTGGPWGLLSEEGTYLVGVNAALTHANFSPCTDHTTGEGLYMIVNGDTVVNENVWCQPVPVDPNTEYLFSGWFTSVKPENPAFLRYLINGEILKEVNLSDITCDWENFIVEWNSGANTQAFICIVNQNTTPIGNDFGIDDIFLRRICRSVDTIHVSFIPGPDVDLGNDTILCAGEELTLVVEGGESYLWNNGSVDSTITVNTPGLIWVEVISENGCISIDTLQVSFAPEINLFLGNDTVLCTNSSLTLDAGEFVSYEWQDNSELQNFVVTEPGLYWVVVTDDFGCTGSDTISVELSPVVMVSLGDDAILCYGDNYTLNPGSGYTSYTWQNGSNATSFLVTSSGTYWVIVTDENGCSGSDTVNITISPPLEVNLGNDTTICTGSFLLLDPGGSFSTYLWQDNSSGEFYSVSSTGQYSVTVTDQFNCEASDEIYVQVTSPTIGLGNDTLLCLGDTINLEPGLGYSAYLWQDNSTNPNFLVLTEGTYSVTVTDIYNCSTEESVEISSLTKPLADLGEDQGFCTGESLTLETIEGPYSYTWNGEPGDYYKEIESEGTYIVEVTNQCGTESDIIVVTEFSVPNVNLGADQVLLPGESIQLDAGEGFDEYIWQDGANGQFYEVLSDQTDPNNPYYWVEVWDGPCKSSDTTIIELFNIRVPNLITPNGDGANDLFIPIDNNWGGVNSHHIDVFNRWGEKIWESDNFEEGWDGKQNGRFVTDGTYFWILELQYGENNTLQQMKGTLTLLGAGE